MKGKNKAFFKHIINTHFRLINWIFFLILHQNVAKSSYVFYGNIQKECSKEKKSEST